MGKIASVAVVLVLLLTGQAQSHQPDHRDPDDVRGRLDIRRVEWFNGSGHEMVTIRTFERFRSSDLQTFNGHAQIGFDTRSGPREDRYARFGHNDAEGLWCAIYTNRDRFVGQGIATREPRALVCGFQRSWLGISRHLRWRVSTSTGGFSTFDEAPAGGRWFDH